MILEIHLILKKTNNDSNASGARNLAEREYQIN